MSVTKDRMTTVRDTIISNMTPDVFLTRDEVAERFNLVKHSTGGSLSMLAKRAILVRRKRGNSNGYEYAAGPRIEFGKKHIGQRFSPRGVRKHAAVAPPAESRSQLVPAAETQLGLILRVNGHAETLTISEARALYQQLAVLFQHKG